MEEVNTKEAFEAAMDKKEFWEFILPKIISLYSKVKSPFRAMRRGQAFKTKPFNNRGNTSKRKGVHSRTMNELKKKMYEAIKRNSAKQSVQ